jgi:integrase/recombinase XerD
MGGEWIEEQQLRELALELAAKDLTEAQRAAVKKVDSVMAVNGRRPATRRQYASFARKMARFLGKPFEEATREELQAFLAKIAERSQHGQSTLPVAKSLTRQFYKALMDPYGEEMPPLVAWIKVRKSRAGQRPKKEVLDPADVKMLAEGAATPRDRAVVTVLYESGARVSEFCGLSVGDVTFDEHGATIPVTGKTGPRRVRLIYSVPYLQLWLTHHPWKHQTNAPLFVDARIASRPVPLMQDGVRAILARAMRHSKLGKHVHPHKLRRSRATELASFLSQFELEAVQGWVPGSAVAREYVFVNQNSVERKILAHAGIVQEEKPREQVRPLATRTCSRCATSNPATSEYCTKCTMPLNEKLVARIAQEREALDGGLQVLLELLKDPEVARLVVKKSREKGAGTPSTGERPTEPVPPPRHRSPQPEPAASQTESRPASSGHRRPAESGDPDRRTLPPDSNP